MSITAALALHARRAPDGVAVVFERDRITWRELDDAVGQLAGFIAQTVPPGRGVALHLTNGPALVLLVLATARAGREAQVLDPEWPANTTREVLAGLAPGLVVGTESGLSCGSGLVLDDACMPFREVVAALGVDGDRDPCPEPDGDVPFYVGFTSGSTGLPKGYRRHHRSWLESFRAEGREFDIDAGDVVLAPGSLTHSLFLYALVRGLNAGAKTIICRSFRPSTALRLIRDEQVTVLYGVPTQIEMILQAADDAGADEPSGAAGPPLGTLRWILSSGAKWTSSDGPRIARVFPQAQFAEFYGASELSFVTVAKDSEAVPSGSVGRAFTGVSVSVRDPDGYPLPAGKVGLVFVESPFVFLGYACAGSKEFANRDGAVSVGDLGFLDERGFLHLVGRASRMIVTSGKNVHPEEIERALERHAELAAAAVLGVADPRRGERLIALVRPHEGASMTRARLIAHLRPTLPLHKVPRVFATVPNWPTTRSGKTDFASLRRLWDAGEADLLA